MRLTKKLAILEHRKMWRWIADETLKRKIIVDKYDYFSSNVSRFTTLPENRCYACEFAIKRCIDLDADKFRDIFKCHFCRYCPIDWQSEAEECMCQDKYKTGDDLGLFSLWHVCCDNGDWEAEAKIAKQIAELKAREE